MISDVLHVKIICLQPIIFFVGIFSTSTNLSCFFLVKLECKFCDNISAEIFILILILRWLAVLIIQFKSAVDMTSFMTNFQLFPWFKRNCIQFWLIFLVCHSFFTPFDKSWRKKLNISSYRRNSISNFLIAISKNSKKNGGKISGTTHVI